METRWSHGQSTRKSYKGYPGAERQRISKAALTFEERADDVAADHEAIAQLALRNSRESGYERSAKFEKTANGRTLRLSLMLRFELGLSRWRFVQRIEQGHEVIRRRTKRLVERAASR